MAVRRGHVVLAALVAACAWFVVAWTSEARAGGCGLLGLRGCPPDSDASAPPAADACSRYGVALGTRDRNPGNERVEPVLGRRLLARRSDGRLPMGFNDDAGTVRTDSGGWLVDPSMFFALQKMAGGQIARYPLAWGLMERSSGAIDWHHHDEIYCTAISRGIRPVFSLSTSPVWAVNNRLRCSRNPCNRPPADDRLRALSRFLEQVAIRYPQAAAVEVWNEPNSPGKYGGRPSAAHYGDRLLPAGYAGVKNGNPRMPVLSGSLANNDKSDEFLDRMYAHGAAQHMDGVAVHAYPVYPVGYRGRYPEQVEQFTRTMRDLRAVLDRHGEKGSRRIWILETGASNAKAETGGSEVPYTQEQQRDTMRWVYEELDASADVDAVMFHRLIVWDGTNRWGLAQFGWISVHQGAFKPKAVFCSFVQALGTRAPCTVGVPIKL